MNGSKKSSVASSSVYMSANENIELESIPASSSDLQKHIKSESHSEKINEAKDEVETEIDAEDVATPLLSQPTETPQIPMSPSDLARMEEIENTFTIDEFTINYREEDNKEGVSLVGDVDRAESQQERTQIVEMLLRILELSRDYIEFVLAGIFLFLFLIFMVGVLPKCFHSLYYDEYALSRSGLTGRVDDTQVYEPGWHFMSPWNEWIKFHKTAHAIRLNDLKVFTTDQLMVKVSFSLYYFLEKNSIGKLYRTLGEKYKTVIHKVCLSEIINTAQTFSIEDFRTNRYTVKNTLKARLSDRLRTDYGINLFDLYFDRINFDKVINDLNLKRVMNQILNEKAEFEKLTAVTYKETDVLVNILNNEALVIKQDATNNGSLGVMKIEQAKYDRIIESTHIEGLKNNFESLNIADLQHKMSFCWVNSLVYNQKIKYYPNNRVNETDIAGYSAFNAAMSLML